ncbi:F0F1 ATP synthase subunit gamma [Thiohalocapsa marina]|uniref:F0F1 ATP synthase subunit gamma n=1 Tax=Thiohalocapsa marina TaxID=424902 RepID=A0A5M8FQY5_9GAMM|nr:FoF1 ATP synthase subunit gamma [Thiohalocapsa marina]KAA6183492.1 F0F1 ATP synthase subunit gamma [Thiohalocapsa marina]
MSRLHELEDRLAGLDDIGKIMRSMKNLAYMESRKLGRFLSAQQRVVASIDSAARDFLAHHRRLLSDASEMAEVAILIGAERGFCGDFNEAVLQAVGGATSEAERMRLIAVGGRLGQALDGDPRLLAVLPGASATEEVPAVLRGLLDALQEQLRPPASARLSVVHWSSDPEQVQHVSVLPPFRHYLAGPEPSQGFPPLLNLSPEAFLAGLIEHFLFAALHESLYSSLMAEQQQRLRHLDAALRRVDERMGSLRLRRNMQRQEEITEEIELILLNLGLDRVGLEH